MLNHLHARPDNNRRAFSMVELLVAMVIGAAVLVGAALVYGTMANTPRARPTYLAVPLGSDVLTNFYGIADESIDAWVAPNYGRRAQADILRERFAEDLEFANAVYCLPRAAGVLNESRVDTIPVAAAFQGRLIDLPDTFRLLLEQEVPASAGTFSSYRGATTGPNLTIFVLEPSGDPNEIAVRAIYDLDAVSVADPAGVYVSVRRYQLGVLTDFYDVFYSGDAAATFSPVAVSFERAARSSLVEGAAIDRLKVAAAAPFYFMWWPDPAVPELGPISSPTYGATDPKASYPAMGARTSLFFAVPMFPAL